MNVSTELRRTFHSSRGAWLAGRRSVIGASDSAAILGHGYADQSIVTIWESKVFGSPDDDEDARLRVGTLIEPALRSIFENETGLQLGQHNPYTIYHHPQFHWMGATLDGHIEEDGRIIPVELKNVGQFNKREWEEEPPLKFSIQLQHQIAVLNAPYGYLFALIGGNDPVVNMLDRNERFISALLPRLESFWGYVERRELPPVDDSEATSKVLGRIFKEREGLTVTLPEDAATWAQDLEKAKADEKDAKKRATAAANKLTAAIGEAAIGEIPGHGRYSWSTVNRAGYEVQPTSYRTLRRMK